MPEPSAAEIELIFTLEDSHRSKLTEVADRLSALGLREMQVLSGIGVITGLGRADALDALRQVPGVAALEPAGEIRIAPPESDIQ